MEHHNNLPSHCQIYYDVNEYGYINGNIQNIIPVFNSLFTTTPDSCEQSIQHYLCRYYFPSCDINVIYPVCMSSCNLLYNNENCSELLRNALTVLANEGITVLPSNNSCERTFLPLSGISDSDMVVECINIEG